MDRMMGMGRERLRGDRIPFPITRAFRAHHRKSSDYAWRKLGKALRHSGRVIAAAFADDLDRIAVPFRRIIRCIKTGRHPD